jgi:hypothetical protein
VSLCRTSSDASQDRRKGRIRWLTLPVKGADLYYEARLQAHIDYNATYCNRRINRKQARSETEMLTREQYLLVNTKYLLLISFQIITYANLIF